MTARSSTTLIPARGAPRRRTVAGLALLTLLAAPALSMQAVAADFPEPRPYGGPPEEVYPERRPPPLRFEDHERCRTILRRRITPDGEEIERRVQVCDEDPGRPPRGRFEAEPEAGYRGPGRLLPPRGVPDDRFSPEDGPGEEGTGDDGPAPYERGGGPRY